MLIDGNRQPGLRYAWGKLRRYVLQAYGAGQFYPGMPGARFIPPQQHPAAQGYAPSASAAYAAGGYGSYAPPAASGRALLALVILLCHWVNAMPPLSQYVM